MSKFKTLMESEGWSSKVEFLEQYVYDLDPAPGVPGICTRPGCSYITRVEPDSASGWCPECGMNSIASALVLAGII